MRILCVIDCLDSGGAQRQLVELAIGFTEYGHQVEFLIYENRIFYGQYLELHGIKITYIESISYLDRLMKFRRFIRSGEYNIVISFLEGASFICEISSIPIKKWKLIVGERNANPMIVRSFRLIIYRWFHFFADFVVSNSLENIKLVKRVNPFLKDHKFRLVYNIVDLDKWQPKTKGYKSILPTRNILVAAAHTERKNLIGLARALQLMDSNLQKRIKIHWYGDRIESPYFDDSYPCALEYIQKNGLGDMIDFFAATHDLPIKIQQADAVALFSNSEGFPNIIAEAMSMGKVVICSRISDMQNILNNVPSLLFNPNDYHEIKNAIISFLNMSLEEIETVGRENQTKAYKMFDKVTNLNAYMELFDQ